MPGAKQLVPWLLYILDRSSPVAALPRQSQARSSGPNLIHMCSSPLPFFSMYNMLYPYSNPFRRPFRPPPPPPAPSIPPIIPAPPAPFRRHSSQKNVSGSGFPASPTHPRWNYRIGFSIPNSAHLTSKNVNKHDSFLPCLSHHPHHTAVNAMVHGPRAQATPSPRVHHTQKHSKLWRARNRRLCLHILDAAFQGLASFFSKHSLPRHSARA